MNKWILIFLFLHSLSAVATEARTISRSPRALLMGDAYTALAEDAYTLFYNPAIMGRHSGFSFWAINPTITASNVLGETDQYEDFPDDPAGIAEKVMGKPIHLGINLTPGFKMGPVALSGIVDSQTNLSLNNAITPMMDIDHRYDRGFILGFGAPIKGKQGGGDGTTISLGASVKYLKREGIYGTYPLTSPSLLNALDGDELGDILTSIGKNDGQGWGVDFGVDYVKKTGASTVKMGLAVLDPYTKIQKNSSDDFVKLQSQPMRVNAGVAWTMGFEGLFALTLSADLKNLNQQMQLEQRTRLGVLVELAMIDLMGGYNAGYYSMGAGVDLGLIEVMAGFYDISLGEEFQQQKGRRLFVYFSLFDFTFDP